MSSYVTNSGCRRITISITAPPGTLEQDILPADVSQDMTIADLKALLEGDTRVTPAAQHIFFNGQELRDGTRTLEQCQVKENDMLSMLVRAPRVSAGGAGTSGQGGSRNAPGPGRDQARRSASQETGSDPEETRLRALADPAFLNLIRSYSADLADAVHDKDRFEQTYEAMIQRAEERKAEEQRQLALLNEDPFNVEAQTKIEEMIRQQRVQENLQHAMDYTPEGQCPRYAY